MTTGLGPIPRSLLSTTSFAAISMCSYEKEGWVDFFLTRLIETNWRSNLRGRVTCLVHSKLNFDVRRTIFFRKTIIAIRFNLLHVFPSVPPFVFAALFIPSFHILSSYFYVLLSLLAVLTV